MAMQSTRWHIMTHLKKTGGSSVDELAQTLDLAPMTIRQHLAILERDSLIGSTEVKRPMGRPRYVYSMTEQGDELFPKGYNRLASRLIEELKELKTEDIANTPEENRLELVFIKMADRMAAKYSGQVKGDTLQERVQKVATILSKDEGTLSEWLEWEDGFIIQDFNCPYYRVVLDQKELCAWHLRLLSQMLEADVTMESCMADGDRKCCYVIQEATDPAYQVRQTVPGIPHKKANIPK